MLPTSARLLKALSLLQSRRFWTGSALAEALGVTERSVRRDVDRLRSLGYPVEATSGVGGGYALGAGTQLPPLPFDDDEAVAVAVGLRAAATGPVSGLEDAAVRALARLDQVLPKRLRARVRALDAVSVRLPDVGPRVDGNVLAALASACRDEAIARFDYADRTGRPSRREVEPYRLVHSTTRWYLLAFDLHRDDWRSFRVDRVTALGSPGPRFRPRPLPSDDLVAWIERGVSTDVYRHRASVTVRAPVDAVRKRIPARYGRAEPLTADTTRLTIGGDDLATMAGWLVLFGWELADAEPPELANAFRDLAARATRAAG